MDQRYGTEVWTERVFRDLIIWLAPIHTYIHTYMHAYIHTYIYICVCVFHLNLMCSRSLWRLPLSQGAHPICDFSAALECRSTLLLRLWPWQQEKWRCWWWTRSWLHWKPCRHMFGKIFAQYAFIHIHTSSIKEWRHEPGLAIVWCANMYIALIPAV